CCGMLMESATTGGPNERTESAVVGIGLNVNQDAFPNAFSDRTTSLALEAGRLIDRTPLLASILNRFERHYDQLLASGGETIRQTYRHFLLSLNERVEVFAAGTGAPLSGIVRGIADNGALLLETASGLRTLASGDVSSRRQGME